MSFSGTYVRTCILCNSKLWLYKEIFHCFQFILTLSVFIGIQSSGQQHFSSCILVPICPNYLCITLLQTSEQLFWIFPRVTCAANGKNVLLCDKKRRQTNCVWKTGKQRKRGEQQKCVGIKAGDGEGEGTCFHSQISQDWTTRTRTAVVAAGRLIARKYIIIIIIIERMGESVTPGWMDSLKLLFIHSATRFSETPFCTQMLVFACLRLAPKCFNWQLFTISLNNSFSHLDFRSNSKWMSRLRVPVFVKFLFTCDSLTGGPSCFWYGLIKRMLHVRVFATWGC